MATIAVPLALVDGTWIFLGAVVLFVLSVAFSLYGRRSRSQMSQHPHGTRRGNASAPGAQGPSEIDRDHGEDAPMQHGTR